MCIAAETPAKHNNMSMSERNVKFKLDFNVFLNPFSWRKSFEKLVQLVITCYLVASILLLFILKISVPKRLLYIRINSCEKEKCIC